MKNSGEGSSRARSLQTERSETKKSWFESTKPLPGSATAVCPQCGVEECPSAVFSGCGTRRAAREDGIVGGGGGAAQEYPASVWEPLAVSTQSNFAAHRDDQEREQPATVNHSTR